MQNAEKIASPILFKAPFTRSNLLIQISHIKCIFDCVNEEFLTNLSKNPNLHGQKNLTYEIRQRKFDCVKGA